MSSQAGLVPVVKFLDALGFGGLFGHHVEHTRAANALYQLGDAAFLVVVGLIGGARSLSQCMALWSDEVLRRVAGWQRLPDQSTLGRVFKEVRERHVSGLETLVHALRQRVWARALRAGRSHLATQCQKWIDADSTVKTVYGRQQGTAKGYNPHKRGARSYHPLLAFCSDTKEIVQAWLRTGSAYTSNGMVVFMQQLLAQFPAHHRLILRADSGFFDGALLDLLDARGHGYLIKVKMRNLAQLLGDPVSEMGHMFYVNLANLGFCTPNDADPASCMTQVGWGLNNTSFIDALTGVTVSFLHVQPDFYWSGLEYAPDPSVAWLFFFRRGGQGAGDRCNGFYAWAVRPGDVAAAPLPGTAVLMALGLLGLGRGQTGAAGDLGPSVI